MQLTKTSTINGKVVLVHAFHSNQIRSSLLLTVGVLIRCINLGPARFNVADRRFPLLGRPSTVKFISPRGKQRLKKSIAWGALAADRPRQLAPAGGKTRHKSQQGGRFLQTHLRLDRSSSARNLGGDVVSTGTFKKEREVEFLDGGGSPSSSSGFQAAEDQVNPGLGSTEGVSGEAPFCLGEAPATTSAGGHLN